MAAAPGLMDGLALGVSSCPVPSGLQSRWSGARRGSPAGSLGSQDQQQGQLPPGLPRLVTTCCCGCLGNRLLFSCRLQIMSCGNALARLVWDVTPKGALPEGRAWPEEEKLNTGRGCDQREEYQFIHVSFTPTCSSPLFTGRNVQGSGLCARQGEGKPSEGVPAPWWAGNTRCNCSSAGHVGALLPSLHRF